MQYKIPVQIENEDPILFWLSLRQLAVIMVFLWLAYSVYQSLFPYFWTEVALIPTIIIWWLWVAIAIFKYSEMTFVPFVLAFLRGKINMNTRKWVKWIDSYSALDIWYVVSNDNKIENKVDFDDKMNKIKEIDEKIDKI